jgi:site-specific DNA-methyltransferase (adenine-specific)
MLIDTEIIPYSTNLSLGSPQDRLISNVYHMDCVEGMQQFPDKFFDLAVVDPPYGIGEDGSNNKSRKKLAQSKDYKPYFGNDKNPPDIDYFTELIRVSKNQIIFGANHFIGTMAAAGMFINSPCWIVWDKENGDSDFADCEIAWTSFKTSIRKFDFRWSGMLQGDMKNKENRIHPNQKPKALYNFIYQKYAKEGMNILDTHLGSGNSRKEAYDNSLNFYGFEMDSYYLNESIYEFKSHLSQQKLFYY